MSNEATLTQARLVTPLGVLSFDSFFSFSFFYFSCSLRSLLFLIFRHILTMIHLHHSTAFKNHLIDKKKSANNNNNNGSPIKTLKDALACSRLRESRVCEMHEEKREETATGPLSKITRSYFRVPFTYASSLLRESLQQNKDA